MSGPLWKLSDSKTQVNPRFPESLLLAGKLADVIVQQGETSIDVTFGKSSRNALINNML
jgi:hypothetical protein